MFAQKIGISSGYLNKVERGVVPVTIKIIRRIYSSFKYSSEEYTAIIAAMKLGKYGKAVDPIDLMQ